MVLAVLSALLLLPAVWAGFQLDDHFQRFRLLGLGEPSIQLFYFFDGDPENAEIAHLAPQILGKIVLAVDLGRPRGNLVGGETHDRVTQEIGGVAEMEIETWQLVRDHVVQPVGDGAPGRSPRRWGW